ncbi:PREDICTED: NADH dehydrogenase [ubiquinone] 1 alpha subcomplex subunit 11-like [Priapulus caudatus]|uniref:NADH dehydrogenase [ubiquinone] 1 alpha subcomplex subunit 11 n=1 Tax=Priapulus caudatus TaxID=37621 RepID=A0ABM1F8P8_PRICU|nr:PREDICTED: NADH dehydrogenase [ubiquinone] 1 alpha subcomplex subunit 11-like [Priapulus caudatus]XP_014680820.1 PREDICTED: NADH dehydrogenase [ubiquinone] 1 alpha subcomplex subunit 11-like [Priapulus caudatus]
MNRGYKYYDTPDGQDCFKKMGYTTKWATFAGFSWSIYDVYLWSHPKGLVPTVARFAHFMLPAAAIGATFSAVTCLSHTYRKKNDAWNYILGGATSGSIIGAKLGRMGPGVAGVLVLGIGGMLFWAKKYEDWPGFMNGRITAVDNGHMRQAYRDWTIDGKFKKALEGREDGVWVAEKPYPSQSRG